MEIEWEQVKKWTLWNYEDLIKRISKVFEYPFVQEYYNHTMKEAEVHATGLLTFGECKHREFLETITASLRTLSSAGVRNYIDLIESIQTREQCEGFLTKTKIPFRELIRFLNYIFRWVLPFTAPMKEFLNKENEEHMSYATKLREFGIKNNIDLLEQGRKCAGRRQISTQTRISESFLLELVNMTDISRIPYIRGKTVKIFCNAGYDTLQKIADTDEESLVTDLKEYLQTVGVKFSKSFIEPDGAIAQASVLPPLVNQ